MYANRAHYGLSAVLGTVLGLTLALQASAQADTLGFLRDMATGVALSAGLIGPRQCPLPQLGSAVIGARPFQPTAGPPYPYGHRCWTLTACTPGGPVYSPSCCCPLSQTAADRRSRRWAEPNAGDDGGYH